MLYMVVANHSPESCPMTNKAHREKAVASTKRAPEVMKKYNVTSLGSWTFVGGHVMYLMLDAPNAHIIGQLVMELSITDWNTVVINPVVTMQDAMAMM